MIRTVIYIATAILIVITTIIAYYTIIKRYITNCSPGESPRETTALVAGEVAIIEPNIGDRLTSAARFQINTTTGVLAVGAAKC